MLTIIVLTCAVVLQFLAGLYALKLIKLTRRSYAWLFISIALFVMMVKRSIPLYYLIFKNLDYPIDLTNEAIDLFLSFFMLLGIVGIQKMFVARNKAEEKAKRSATRTHDLSKYANDFLEVNERVVDFYGYTHDELIGMHLAQLPAPEAKEEFINQIKIARNEGKVLTDTLKNRSIRKSLSTR
ncbi:MAG: PAS domain-containing protein [Syntrophaceae bacterium]|nr:PAS domain-containing protein [Syntrophaceae bacterium]